jgi:hypothetical protein
MHNLTTRAASIIPSAGTYYSIIQHLHHQWKNQWHVLFENPDSYANVKLENTQKRLRVICGGFQFQEFLRDRKTRRCILYTWHLFSMVFSNPNTSWEENYFIHVGFYVLFCFLFNFSYRAVSRYFFLNFKYHLRGESTMSELRRKTSIECRYTDID